MARRKSIEVPGGTANLVVDANTVTLKGSDQSAVTVTGGDDGGGVSMQGSPGKDTQIMTSSTKKAFVRDMPFPLSLVPGPYSMPKQIPDVPFMPMLPYIPIAVAAGFMIVSLFNYDRDEGGGGC